MITDSDLERLKSNIEYLAFEVEALKGVIEEIPYSEKPLESSSALDILYTISVRQDCYLQLVESVLNGKEAVLISKVKDQEHLSFVNEKDSEVNDLISSIKKKREELYLLIKDKDASFFKVEVRKSTTELNLFELFQKMIAQERKNLKEIGEIALTYQTDLHFQRQLKTPGKG